MKAIPLTQGKVALVDDRDYRRVIAFRWYARQDKKTGIWYASRQEPTGLEKPRQRTIRLHRFITDAPLGTEVDHKNRDGLDDRRQNLRVTDKAGNQRNRGRQKNNTSGFKGVVRHHRGNRWVAQLKLSGQLLYLGCFKEKTEAAAAYDRAALKYHGEFAKTNFGAQS